MNACLENTCTHRPPESYLLASLLEVVDFEINEAVAEILRNQTLQVYKFDGLRSWSSSQEMVGMSVRSRGRLRSKVFR